MYLKSSYDLIWSRMQQQTDHYMKSQMLKSQFEALQKPANALIADVAWPVNKIMQQILEQMD